MDAFTQAEAQDLVPEVKVEDVGPARKRLEITVPATVVDERLEKSLGHLTREAAIPGFRRGRAPRHLIERRFGPAIRDETKQRLISEAYGKAIQERKLRTVGDPEPAGDLEDLTLESGKPLTFSVDVEVVPEFELPNLEGVEIKKPVIEITEEHLDRELEQQLIRHGRTEEVEDEAKANDWLQGRLTVTDEEGETRLEAEEAAVHLPTGDGEEKAYLQGLPIEKPLETLGGKKPGETVEFTTVGPSAHEQADLRGRELRVRFEVTKVHRVKPATPEELMEQYQLEDEAALREQVRLALERRAAAEQRAAMREQVFDYLLNSVDFPVPERMSASQARRLLDRTRIEMFYQGASVDEVEARLGELRSQSEEEAKRRLKLFFLLHAAADALSVQVSDAEVNGRIAEIAMQRGQRPEQMRAELVKAGRIDQIAMQIREHKTADRVIEQAKVEEITAEAWNEMVRSREGAASAASAGA